ncbi:MAG: FG-GAP repeat protein [Planctomycetes bacterium]|nr:FG-GAP repeat protein [Planctomycetota bacterium]
MIGDQALSRSVVLVAFVAVGVGSHDASAQQILAEWDSQHSTGAWDLFGNDIAVLGDVNGDGWVDVLVGSLGYDVSGANYEDGAAFVVSTQDGSFLRQHFGSARFGRFGLALDGGPDLDGDRVPDYAVGAPLERGKQAMSGRVHVFSGATGAVLYVLDGERNGDDFGYDLSFVGDLDGDGASELVVVAEWWDDYSLLLGQCGRAYCYSGRTGATLWTVEGVQQDQMLARCCPMDDFNGDGVPEVGLGSIGSGSGSAGEGTFDVIDGKTGFALQRIAGQNALEQFGHCGQTGDIDGDGVRDLLIGAPNWPVPSTRSGRVYVVSGATLAELHHFDGEAKNEYLGAISMRFGQFDANGDGWPDIVFGAAARARAGCSQGVESFYCGRTFRLLYELRAQPVHGIDDTLGVTGGTVGDVDGDGFPDAIVTAYGGAGGGGGGAGRVYLVGMKPIFLQGDRSEYTSGDSITLRLTGGAPGVLGLIAVVSVDGVPLFQPVSLAALDSFGELTYSDVADPTLAGLTIEVQGLCQKPTGRGVLFSVPETIEFR